MLTCKTADNAIRWKDGERLHHLFEQRCDQLHASSSGPRDAVIVDDAVYTFRDLDNRANQVARFLIGQGLASGDRIGLLFDKGRVQTYIALLAVLKINAAYVPLDASFPNDRIAFILEDAGVKALISLSPYRDKLKEFGIKTVFLDEADNDIDGLPTARLSGAESAAPVDQLAYLIYTSGTTGKPKGVAIEHPSICNFVRVAAEVYGMRPGDRCYQGMTIAFDFSVEELWVPLIAGATLVPARPGTNLVGSDLADFLFEKHVTVVACVPTLLATIERDLPDLRILLVSGEACPQNLVVRWHRPGRVILNAYGPTEATVTATLTELYPDKPVTIGGPLPTYTIVILDPDKGEQVAPGALGEIGIAGIGLAQGYLNRPDLTEQKFIPDFLDIPNNPSKRIYRSGDLGRINDQDEVEFHGRIDTQVKIRGYRIELTEIESVLMQLPQIAAAVVDKYEPEPGTVELVAYYSLKQGASPVAANEIAEILRKNLPVYMIPAYIEELPVIPLTSSHKADRKNLPAPKGPRFSAPSTNYIAPRTPTEKTLEQALMEVMKIERVSVADNFFQDLGAHSLLMARFAAEIRKRLEISAVSMRDIYLNPTIEKLALHLSTLSKEAAAARTPAIPVRIASNFEYVTCGALQLGYYLVSAAFGLWLLKAGFEWTYVAIDRPFELYLRLVAYGLGTFALANAIPIAVKWLLIGRWKEEIIPVWSLSYFRFWLVKTMTSNAPMALMGGTPMYSVYLRCLGAKIGKNTVVQPGPIVCTDLISVGSNTIVRRDGMILGYKAQSNYIFTGPVSIGDNVFVGEAVFFDINTAMEDNTQMGHASSLQAGQRVPKGKHYHGSPAQETAADYNSVEQRSCTLLRRWVYSGAFLAGGLILVAPLAIMLMYYAFPHIYQASSGPLLDLQAPWPTLLTLAVEVLAVSAPVFLIGLVLGLLVVVLVPRLLYYVFLRENKTYVLYGVHYFVFQIVASVSNSAFYGMLFGDSALIVHYLRWIGYKLNTIIQTGSNFGLEQRHDVPFLCDIGSGTMVSDGLTMINGPMSNSSFRLNKVKIGDHNYLGNRMYYPAEGKTGANCLLGTKVMIPIDGPVRENVGLLGSPPFEIPRAVDRDRALNSAMDDGELRQRIAEKTRFNLSTMFWFLLSGWVLSYVLMFSLYVALLYFPTRGLLSILAYGVFAFVVSVSWFIFLEKASLKFKPLTPKVVSMYDMRFWEHERYWKFTGSPVNYLFPGTPFKNIISRLLGVAVGKKVFDDGCSFFDKTLIEVGDHVTLSSSCVMQGHSLEEGVFKCDRIKIGNGSTLGCGAFVHYGVTMGDNVVLEPDSFLMKGEILGANAVWQGNPARAVN